MFKLFSVSLTSRTQEFSPICRQFRPVLLPKVDVRRRQRDNGKQHHSITLRRRRFQHRASQICQMPVCGQQTKRKTTSVRFLFYSFLTKIISIRIEIEIRDSRELNRIITFARRDLQSEIVQFYTIEKVLIKFNICKQISGIL